MPIQTRAITATISDFDGEVLEGARVIIKLVGLGNEPAGAVSPGTKEGLTDENGVATFELWENRQDYSDTYYEISSYHPDTGQAIHQREQFLVFDSDADVKDLIGLQLAGVDATQALLNQVAQDRAAAAAFAASASSSAGTATAQAGIATVQAGISTTKAGESADSASSASSSSVISTAQAIISTEQAVISTAQAGISTTKAGEALASAGAALNSENVSTTQAVIATTKAGEAQSHAGTSGAAASVSTAQAVIATTQAGISTTKAGEAATSAAQTASDLTATAAAKNLAEKWADEAEDTQVITGRYSAYHWAKKAEDLVAGATEGAIVTINGQTGPSVTLTPAMISAATAAQGALADTAIQPSDLSTALSAYVEDAELVTVLADYVTVTGLASDHYTKTQVDTFLSGKASSAQGAKADSALQPADLLTDPHIKKIRTLALAGII